MGIFGSLFISNMIRVIIHSVVAPRVYENNSSLLRFIVTKESVEIITEINLVKQAEKLLESVPIVSRRLLEEEIIVEAPERQSQSDRIEHNGPFHQYAHDKHPTIEDKDSDDAVSINDLPISFHEDIHIEYSKSPDPTLAKKTMGQLESPTRKSLDFLGKMRKSIEKSMQDQVRYKTVLENDGMNQ